MTTLEELEESRDNLKDYMLSDLNRIPIGKGGSLKWGDKTLSVFHDMDGYFWMDAKCFTMSGAVDYAVGRFMPEPKPTQTVFVVIKEYDHGSCTVGVFHDEADAHKKRDEVRTEYMCIAAHVTWMEVQ